MTTPPVPPEAITAQPWPGGKPVLAAAAEAIIKRHLAFGHGTGTEESRRAAIALTALEDAAAALEAAAPLIAAAAAEIPVGIITTRDHIDQAQVDELAAAWRAAWDKHKDDPLQVVPDAAVLTPVADLIADAVAAERERIRQLAADRDAFYGKCPHWRCEDHQHPFADLIGGDQ